MLFRSCSAWYSTSATSEPPDRARSVAMAPGCSWTPDQSLAETSPAPMMGVGGADMAAICSEDRLPSSDGGADPAGTSCAWCACTKEMTAGDISTLAGGVGGTGVRSFLNSGRPDKGSAFWSGEAGIVNLGSRRWGGSLDAVPRLLAWRFNDDFLGGILWWLVSSSETSYMSSKSVTSVEVLLRFQGFEEDVGELVSSTEEEEGEEGRIGADKKWKPRGVGK